MIQEKTFKEPIREAALKFLTVPLFVCAMFFSAGMIFIVQPLFARIVSPMLGSAPAVWNTSMVFFQAALLLGYVYAHFLQRLTRLSVQVAIHAILVLLCFISLPLAPSALVGEPDTSRAVSWLLATLILSVGGPYTIASATAPLLQSWYSKTQRSDSADPYHLYAASNLGSLVGLIAYPLIVEPFAGISLQSLGWSWMFVAVMTLVVLSGIVTVALASKNRKDNTSFDKHVPLESSHTSVWRERSFWLIASAIPSGLLIAVTDHIVADIASAPFLWIPPLALYLLTFVIAFGVKNKLYLTAVSLFHAATVAVLIALPWTRSVVAGVGLRLLVLFLSAMICHGALASARPRSARLTEYYLFVSLGGVIGSAAIAILEPLLFDRMIGYPILIAAVFFFYPSSKKENIAVQIVAAFLGISSLILAYTGSLQLAWPMLGIVAAAIFINRTIAWLVLPLITAPLFLLDARGPGGMTLLRERTFFGSHRVVAASRPNGVVHMLMHGSTMHGAQWRDSARQTAALTYYAEGSALSDAVLSALPIERSARIALIGLGTGAMACVIRDGDSAFFVEIDKSVAAIALDTSYFTYLNRCPRNTEIEIGDGRVVMSQQPQGSFDVVLIDAFTSDAIPAHLLTQEAFRVWEAALVPGGVIIVHVSNRHMAIANEVLRVGQAEGFSMRIWRSASNIRDGTGDLESPTVSAIVLVRDPIGLEKLALGSHWTVPPRLPGRPWSDDYINLIRPLWETGVDSMASYPAR